MLCLNLQALQIKTVTLLGFELLFILQIVISLLSKDQIMINTVLWLHLEEFLVSIRYD